MVPPRGTHGVGNGGLIPSMRAMSSPHHHTTAVIIGAGHAGLAMSRCLTDHGVDHAVLERGRVAERWRSERWDSLRLLTPRWQSRLPGWHYRGGDPDGYFTMPELIGHLEGYAASFDAPVHTSTAVTSVRRAGRGYAVVTDRGTWAAANVVVATGACDRPAVPAAARHLDAAIPQVTPNRYRSPEALPAGGVLVVGASATGVQLASELRASGRAVVLAVGRHTRVPRRYRGLDIQWWLDRLGILDVAAGDVGALDRARREPSLQLAGDPFGRTLDLLTLASRGVRLAGHVERVGGSRVEFADDLPAACGAADRRLDHLLARIDDHVDWSGLRAEVDEPECLPPFTPRGLRSLDLRRAGVTTVIWATGYRRAYPWLQVPVLDRHGEIRHRGGVTPMPGLYVLGLPFQRHRNSTFLDGTGRDAEHLATHMVAALHDSPAA
ncbi:MAG: flavin-containing monooxygenase [Acidimicrobiales bacterium]